MLKEPSWHFGKFYKAWATETIINLFFPILVSRGVINLGNLKVGAEKKLEL